MALSHFAARALVSDYLAGRAVPDLLQRAVVQAVECRLIAGMTPVLDEHLRRQIDSEADEVRSGPRGQPSHVRSPGPAPAKTHH